MTSLLLGIQGGPESPNFITLIYRAFAGAHWAETLHYWENVIFSIIIAILISSFFYLGASKNQLIPSGLQNFLEWIVESFHNLIVGILGPKGSEFVPFIGTLFIYILCMNLFGLIPLMHSPSSSLNITVGLAICVFFRVQYLNVKNMGLGGFIYHMAGSPKDAVGWLMVPIMFPIELLTQFTRPITLALRLFGNILGEKILISFFAIIGVTLLYFFPIQTPFMFLGLLTSLMQAMVFTLLTTIYILLSEPHTEEYESNH